MKVFKFNKIKALLVIAIMGLMTNCDLELQDDFKFEPEVDLTDPFDDLTAWEWIQTKKTVPFVNDDGETVVYDGELFDFFIAAIKAAGFENQFNDSNSNRTYLLLNNNAFFGGGDIVDIITGSDSIIDDNGTPDDETDDRIKTPEEVMAGADIEKLRKILSYHIVTTYIAQVPTLREYGVDYIFQTLIPGEKGRIAFRRDERYRVSINNSSSPLPTSATSQNENVRGHNYVFKNGIGHIIADPVRYEPY